jgi:hypothetical protein
MSMAGGLAPSNEDNIPLARVYVLVLKEEKVVNAVVA